jgi:hypothetical protein
MAQYYNVQTFLEQKNSQVFIGNGSKLFLQWNKCVVYHLLDWNSELGNTNAGAWFTVSNTVFYRLFPSIPPIGIPTTVWKLYWYCCYVHSKHHSKTGMWEQWTVWFILHSAYYLRTTCEKNVYHFVSLYTGTRLHHDIIHFYIKYQPEIWLALKTMEGATLCSLHSSY